MASDRSAYFVRYRAEHREARAAYFKDYRGKHRDKINKRNAAWMKRHRKAQRKAARVKA